MKTPEGAASAARDLVVIEAPGKIKTFHRILAEAGIGADVCATIGHFLENPRTLREPALVFRDGAFVETARRPHRADAYSYLCERIKSCGGRILVATDNDDEGHVIAQDVADLAARIAPGTPTLRVLLQSLDAPSLRCALGEASPVEPSAAVPGTARRICDRLIGVTLGDFDGRRPVGRVQSALLGMAADGIAFGEARVLLPCADGGKPFVGGLPLVGEASPADLIAALPPLLPAAVVETLVVPLGEPLSYADAVLDLHEHLRMSIADAARLLQTLYEAGEISYPRTASRGYSEASAAQVERQARARGLIAFKRGLLPGVEAGSAHEAIRVTAEERLRRIEVSKPLKLQANERDAALALIARRSIEAGTPVRRERPDLRGLPESLRGLRWARDTRMAVLTWRYAERAAVQMYEPEAAMVRAMRDRGMGRPSTVADHACRFIERGLVDGRMRLTEKGKAWLSAAPSALRDPATTALIESTLARRDCGVAELVGQAIALACREESTRNRVFERIASRSAEVPPRWDRAEAAFGVGEEDALAVSNLQRSIEVENDVEEHFSPTF